MARGLPLFFHQKMRSCAELTFLTILITVLFPDLPLDKEDGQPWTYTVGFHYEPDHCVWMAEGQEDFLLLSSEVVDALIAEAHEKGHIVRYLDSHGNFLRV